MNPLNVIRRARSRVRLDSEDKDTQATTANKLHPPLPAFVSSASGDTSFLQMDPSPNRNALRGVRSREKKKSKGTAAPPVASTSQSEFNLDTDLERMEGIIDPSLLPQSNGPSVSSASWGEASTSALRADGRALTPSSSSSSPPNFGGPVFSDPFISSPPGARAREGVTDRRMSPHAITPAVLPPQLVSPPSGAQDGMAAWKAPPSWVSGDQPEPDVSSSEDEKASASKRKSRRRTTTPRTLQSQVMDMRIYKIRVYRANNEYYILTCGLTTTVGQLSGKLNSTILNPGEREDHRLYLKERGRGLSSLFIPLWTP